MATHDDPAEPVAGGSPDPDDEVVDDEPEDSEVDGDDVAADPDEGGKVDGDASQTRPIRRRLDARTIGICVCIALLGALAAGLVASRVVGDDDSGGRAGDGRFELEDPDVQGVGLAKVPLKTPAGKPTTLADHLGTKPTVVNLWQQSCKPCTAEMPLLEQLHQTDDRVAVVGVDTQDRIELAKQMAASTGITYPWVRDDRGDFFYEAKGVAMPTTLLVASDGSVLAKQTGDFKSLDEIKDWVTENLPRSS